MGHLRFWSSLADESIAESRSSRGFANICYTRRLQIFVSECIAPGMSRRTMSPRYQIFLQTDIALEDAAAALRRRFAAPIVQQQVGDKVQFTFTCLGVNANLQATADTDAFENGPFAKFPYVLAVSADGELGPEFDSRASFKEVALFLAGLIDHELGWPCMVVYNDTLIIADSSQ